MLGAVCRDTQTLHPTPQQIPDPAAERARAHLCCLCCWFGGFSRRLWLGWRSQVCSLGCCCLSPCEHMQGSVSSSCLMIQHLANHAVCTKNNMAAGPRLVQEIMA